MKSVLRMSEQELSRLDAGTGFQPLTAALVATASSVLALLGMMLRYVPGEKTPIPGMDHFQGQCFLAALLGLLMLTTAWLVRSVIVKRLQWAVLFSLIFHLMLCLTLKEVAIDLPLAAAEFGAEDRPAEEMVLPDYGGMESPSDNVPEWQRPTEVDLPESPEQELQRQETEPQPLSEPRTVEHQQMLRQLEIQRQQEQQQRLQEEAQLELQRQMQQAQSDAPQQVESPRVQTQDAPQSQPEARELQKQQTDLQNTQRTPEEIASQRASMPEAVQIEAVAESQPDTPESTSFTPAERQVRDARTETSIAESFAPTTLQSMQQPALSARVMELQRQRETNLPNPDAQSVSVERTTPQLVRSSTSRAQMAPSTAFSDSRDSAIAALPRQSTATANPAAVESMAEAVSVNASGNAAAPALQAANTSSGLARGSQSVPLSAAAGGGAPTLQSSRFGTTTLQSGQVRRSAGSSSGPQLGQVVDNGLSDGSGRSRSMNSSTGAVGAQAESVSVASAASAGSGRQLISEAASSSSTTMQRGSVSLPATSSGFAATTAPSSSSTRGDTGRLLQPSANAGLSGRQTGPMVGSTGLTSGGDVRLPSRSSSGGIRLSDQDLAAEQSGQLVFAGPQATPAANSNASGLPQQPRSDAGISRRSAGLPGLPQPAGGTLARTTPRLPGSLPTSGAAPRPLTSASRPAIATTAEIQNIMKRAAPGISPIPSDRISAAFSMRTPEFRAEAVRTLGGSEASESAVVRGLEWLAVHQAAAGNWSIHNLHCRDHDCSGAGSYDADPAATGLALLAFLGAGHTHRTGEHQQVVQRGLKWLIDNQKPDGDLFAAETEFARFYSHGMATIALCEAYGMTKDPALKEPAQKAVNYICECQHPTEGGWRYLPQFESDTSVSGWQLMALKSAEMAGLRVPRNTLDGVQHWLNGVESQEAPGRFAYHPSKEPTDSMTAEGLLMRQYLGADRTDSALQAGASYLQQRLPNQSSRDVYYWYYATQVMFHMQGDFWNDWNAGLRDMLVETQEKGGSQRGSWDTETPGRDAWGKSGGRLYVTCLNLLMLEVYYRHLPLYIELNDQSAGAD